MAKSHRKHKKPASAPSFDALNADSSPKAPPRKAPNPLRNARPERLQAAREEVMRIIAARRNGLTSPER